MHCSTLETQVRRTADESCRRRVPATLVFPGSSLRTCYGRRTVRSPQSRAGREIHGACPSLPRQPASCVCLLGVGVRIGVPDHRTAGHRRRTPHTILVLVPWILTNPIAIAGADPDPHLRARYKHMRLACICVAYVREDHLVVFSSNSYDRDVPRCTGKGRH
jgi:hypothetical protein